MRRLSLSTKLLAAALPLVVALGALLTLTVRSDLAEVARAESGAELGAVWGPLTAALDAVEDETDLSATIGNDPDAAIEVAASRRTTDTAINDLRASVEQLGAAEAATQHITASRSALSAARRNLDMAAIAPEMAQDADPVEAYELAGRELVSVGQLLPAESNEAGLGQELLAVVKLAEAKLAGNNVAINTAQWPTENGNTTPLVQARASFVELEAVLKEFEAIAPEDWAAEYRQSGFPVSLAGYRSELESVSRAAEQGNVEVFDTAGFVSLLSETVTFQQEFSQSIVDSADTVVAETRSDALTRTVIILAAAVIAMLVAWLLTRSVTRRIKAVSAGANQVATEQLPVLVEALRDPRGKTTLPDIAPIDARGGDEVAELAEAFNSMQSTLVEVAHEQVEVLRRGVSDIFVTMARRNRSLIDRQLAMLDEYEAEVDDPDVLSNYYNLDHLSTRMRRNSESLLVLANAEPKRRRVKATEIDDVVRASIGEVEDYRRVEIEALESLQLRGSTVADVSHMLAELLDNATSFSPPDSAVRVGGRHTGDTYMLRIVDNGVGVGPDRLRELNELLRDPPIVGLSVEATLGMSVVSLLANKHGIEVTLLAGNPGLTVDVILPAALFGPIDKPYGDAPVADVQPIGAPIELPDESLVEWTEADTAAAFGEGQFTPSEPESAPIVDPADAPVMASDWTKMTLDMTAFMTEGETDQDAPEQLPNDLSSGVTHQLVTSDDDVAIEYDSEAAPVDFGLSIPMDGLGASETIQNESVESVESTESVESVGETIHSDTVDTTDETIHDVADEVSPVVAEAPVAAVLPIRPPLPPPAPAAAAAIGEFDRPAAPPMTPTGLAQRPVSPETARPAPRPEPAVAAADGAPSLPTRSPGNGPDGGADRLAGNDDSPVAAAGAPSALQAALSAFSAGRNGDTAPTDAPAFPSSDAAPSLPTRGRNGDSPHSISVDESPAITQSRLDPEALRERLRAFQSEFRTGHTATHVVDRPSGSHTNPDFDTATNTDLGGDR